jgi:DNA-binding Lrp family transcriptional regulator
MTATEKVLLAEVDSFTSRDQSFYKSNETIAADLGCSVSTAKRAVAKLLELDLVERTTFDGRRRGLASQLEPADRPEWTDSQTKVNPQPVQNDPADGPNGTASNTIKRTKKRTSKVVMPWEGFEETWQDWKDYKKTEHRFTFKSASTEQAALHHLAKICSNDRQTATTSIHASIANGWKGLFTPKQGAQKPAPTESDRGVFAAYIRTGNISDDA